MTPLLLQGFCVSGFEGVPPETDLTISDFGHRNILIGQNNTGKSIAIRFLQMFQANAKEQNQLPFRVEANVNSSSFWQHEDDREIKARLTFTNPDPNAEKRQEGQTPGKMFFQGTWHLDVRITAMRPQGRYALTASPLIEFSGEFKPLVCYPDHNANNNLHLANSGDYHPENKFPESTYKGITRESLTGPFHSWLKSCRFFDPFRALTKQGPRPTQTVEDGSGLLGEMLALQNDASRAGDFEKLRRDLLRKLNNVFMPGFISFEMKPSPAQMWLRKDTPFATSVPLTSMGSGLSQMIIAYAALVNDGKQHKHYFLEEPESNLHPKLLRQFIKDIGEYKNIRFFISTHSSIILDSLTDQDKVFYFSQNEEGACSAVASLDIVTMHNVLDSLGVSGSSLLQTNCVIWVEGPSDRLYLRRWIAELTEARKLRIQEGIDYGFAFYGGKVLSHFDFEPGDGVSRDFVSLLRISRFSAVLMDRDSKWTKAKKRIIEEARKDPGHRLACLTRGREVENDIPIHLIRIAAEDVLKCDKGKLDTLSLAGAQQYPKEIIAHLGLTGDEAKAARRKLSRKVALAQLVLDYCNMRGDRLVSPDYCVEILDFIVKSRVI